jgi:hypothetical protein
MIGKWRGVIKYTPATVTKRQFEHNIIYVHKEMGRQEQPGFASPNPIIKREKNE